MPDEEKPNLGYPRLLPDFGMTTDEVELRAAIDALQKAFSISDIRASKRLLARVCLYVTIDERQLNRNEWLAEIQQQPLFCRYDTVDVTSVRIDGSMASVAGWLGRSAPAAADASARGRQADRFEQGWTHIRGAWLLHYSRITATRHAAGLPP